ncbi:LysR family transcriptional regulator [Bacillus sp. 1P06AnD]|uniref:LysR family transcriptional regulator n=1 Tax=Bacillus sp. 1P06AnD TaxID=3132208 RepID=UPI0039A2E9FE
MDLTKLNYFTLVAKYENFSKAAEETHISQPALSKAISSLEQDLGLELFHRQAKRIRLNENGKLLQKRLQPIFADLVDVERELSERKALEKAQLRIISTMPYMIMQLIDGYLDRYPDTHIYQAALSEQNINDFIHEGTYDLCITTDRIDHPHLEWLLLDEEQMYISVPRNHPMAEMDTIDLENKTLEHVIGLPASYSFRQLTDHWCSSVNATARHTIEVEESTIILQLVRAGKGISFSPHSATHLYRDDIHHIKIENYQFKRKIGLLLHRHYHRSSLSKKFVDYCKDFFS